MSGEFKLDELDRAIIAAIKDVREELDGHAGLVDIAGCLSRPRQMIWYRLARLMTHGYLTSEHRKTRTIRLTEKGEQV